MGLRDLRLRIAALPGWQYRRGPMRPDALAQAVALVLAPAVQRLVPELDVAEIAASLFMSEATVKAHVSRLLTKLAVTNRVHIAILVHDAQS